uniref:Nucleotide-diphospho-sugar transferase domain-containing protein n=1 Tax=Ananas comosus var. bracteatus TaxID=296719 RepID=A0A6V7QPB8_ANACO|nr:unnamed protein product [Ananas comosus var. bracteatus]
MECASHRFVGLVTISLLIFAGTYTCLWPAKEDSVLFSWFQRVPITRKAAPKDELEIALQRSSMKNRTLIISVLNKAYAEENGLLYLFLKSLREGEDTESLIKHLLLVAVDETAFNRCKHLNLHCFLLNTTNTSLSTEQLFMSEGFLAMMWQRIRFLGDVLKRGYSFIFTDMDVLWLRNPFSELNREEDMQMSIDMFNGNPYDDFNGINTGFFFVASSNKTIALFDEWYASRNNSKGVKEQDVLNHMKSKGAFRRLGMKVRYLDTAYFSGFCQDSRDFKKVTTVHANCCRTVKAKISDLSSVLRVWKKFVNGTLNVNWPVHSACHSSWKTKAATEDKLEIALKGASMGNKTLIITVLNKAYAEENGMIDLFLKSLTEGEQTKFLIKYLLFVAVDQTAFDRCKKLDLHCYQLNSKGTNLSTEQLFMTSGFIEMMWQRTRFLGDVLRHGYSFVFTDTDVMWLRNPFLELNKNTEDMQFSCDGFNGNPFDDFNGINTGFFYITSNNKTTALFDEWYALRNYSKGMKEQDVLNRMKSEGAFRWLGMKVRYLDTEYFSGFCSDSRDYNKVTTVHANCCRTKKAKIADLTAVLDSWKTFDATSNIIWPAHKACHDSWETTRAPEDKLEVALQSASMESKTLIITFLNKAYAEENGLLDLFLQSFKEGDDTEHLIKHLLLVAADQTALDRCKLLKLNCYKLNTMGRNYSKEQLYMTEGFIEMMWQRVLLLRNVLQHGYNFIFTDMDIVWLKNPFTKLNNYKEDLQISCDGFNGRPFDSNNSVNTGFFFVASNNKTIALFDEWYGSRNNSQGMKEQDVLRHMISQGAFGKFGVKVRYLDTAYFSGFCSDSTDAKKVTTVHANCCRSVSAKLTDLKAVLETSRGFNGSTVTWPEHRACKESWKRDITI